MARLKLKQVLSNLSYDRDQEKLTLTGTNDPSFDVQGSINVQSSGTVNGTITIQGIDTFGDSGSFYSVDLGTY
jgi:hypothetical protein